MGGWVGGVGSYSDYKANLSSTATAVGIATGTELELSFAKIQRICHLSSLIRKKHPDLKPFKCVECGETTQNEIGFKTHSGFT